MIAAGPARAAFDSNGVGRKRQRNVKGPRPAVSFARDDSGWNRRDATRDGKCDRRRERSGAAAANDLTSVDSMLASAHAAQGALPGTVEVCRSRDRKCEGRIVER